MSCVFCPDNWENLDIVQVDYLDAMDVAIINPLEPVTEGHVLVIGSVHTKDASVNPWSVSSRLMSVAGAYVQTRNDLYHGEFQANIITSIGPLATQTVFHTHVHIVPRRENDGLPLPWTPQHELNAAMSEGRKTGDYSGVDPVFQRWPGLSERVQAQADRDEVVLRAYAQDPEGTLARALMRGP